ncbi:DUF167 domain-containing protein [Legionella fairfieldensis]|uniref:DUF167 domain-containing protein n=1 Tax=Legionella fairfieldensis TaxID=45064 RepID=UPI000B17F365|nr:DUF167 domain-containing protein [Legionella fairfieldensis]
MEWYKYTASGVTIYLYVQPGAKRTRIAGVHGEALKIQLNASPIEGRANEALLNYMARFFDVPIRQVTLIRGHKSRYKMLKITGSSIDPVLLLERC